VGSCDHHRTRVCGYGLAFNCSGWWRSDLGVKDGEVQDAVAGVDGGAADCFKRCGQTAGGKFRAAFSGDSILVSPGTTSSLAASFRSRADELERLAGVALYGRQSNALVSSGLFLSFDVWLFQVVLSISPRRWPGGIAREASAWADYSGSSWLMHRWYFSKRRRTPLISLLLR